MSLFHATDRPEGAMGATRSDGTSLGGRLAAVIIAPVRRFFAAEGSPVDLAVFRIILFGALLHQGTSAWDYAWLASLPTELRSAPIFTEWAWNLVEVSPRIVRVVQPVFIAACAGALVGVWTRVASITAAALGLYLLGLPQIYGKVDHYNHLWWFAAILAASKCADALSVDQWRRRGPQLPAVRSREYALPLRFVWVLMGLIYLFPGFAKLGMAGDWVTAENMRNHLHAKWWELTLAQGSRWVPLFQIDRYPALLTLSAAATIAFETTFLPILLFVRRSRSFLVPAGLAFHGMTTLLMGISFWQLVVCYAGMISWDQRRPVPTLPPATGVRPVRVVGTGLVVINYLFGSFHLDSWPFSIYPTFAYLAKPPTSQSPARAIDPVVYTRIADKLGTARWHRMIARSERDSTIARGVTKLVARENNRSGL